MTKYRTTTGTLAKAKMKHAHTQCHYLMDSFVPVVDKKGVPMSLDQRVAWLVAEMAKLKRGNKPLEAPFESKRSNSSPVRPGLDTSILVA